VTDTSASVPTPVADGAAGERSQPPPSPSAPADDRARPVPSGVDDVPTARSLDLLHGVEMTVTVELGRTKMLLRDLLALQTGSVIELDRPAGSPVDVLINDNLLARGEVVVLDDEFGVRILDIVLADGQPGRH
jgi:flagellar motor switch protein FliN/FliY